MMRVKIAQLVDLVTLIVMTPVLVVTVVVQLIHHHQVILSLNLSVLKYTYTHAYIVQTYNTSHSKCPQWEQ